MNDIEQKDSDRPKLFDWHTRKMELISLSIFILLTLWMYIVHEPWADEAQAWLIASNYSNPFTMLVQGGYEGSPMLWHIILWIFSQLGLQIWSMRLFHSIVAIISAFLILWYAPFKKYQRVISIFGYYFVFEYNAIARSYALTVVLLAYLGYLYPSRYDKQLQIGITLALLAQTNIHGMIYALVLFGTMGLERLIEEEKKTTVFTKYYKLYLPFIVSVLIAVIVLLPPDDLPTVLADWSSIRDHDPIGYSQFFTMRGFFPIHTLEPYFWTYDLRVSLFGFQEAKIIATSIIVLIILQLSRKGYPVLILLPTLIGYNILYVYKRGICPRHCGLIYIIYFFTYWYSFYYQNIQYGKLLSQWSVFLKNSSPDERNETQENASSFFDNVSRYQIGSKIFTIIIIIQLISMPIPVYHDTNSSFSHAEDVANYLIDTNMVRDDVLLVGHTWFPTMAIIPHLPEGHQHLYFIEQQEFGTYVTWNDEFFNSIALSPDQVIERSLSQFNQGQYNELVLILDYVMDDDQFYEVFTQLKYFDNALIVDENFYLYKLK